ncbi:nucleoside-diphosphate kinase [Paraliobacillus sediminis]|uniref:nucleoside-diphosphate kinase n=1 Tax=Paraliobacillus sediminis TaxID=1885916 RepID=UPI000E3DD0D4|nr:nucleoside-diphosphate kinase [Paraliobacillus sediminis]
MANTFIMIKPDGVKRAIIGELISRFEEKGYRLIAAKMVTITNELADQHYQEHRNKEYYPGLKEYITSGPVFAMVWAGEDIVEQSRILIGATDPAQAKVGTIRADFGTDKRRNVIHSSDSLENARREINLFFSAL